MDLFQAIRERRSIRKYKATAVSEEQLNTIFEAVRWTPSWANTQCWSFVDWFMFDLGLAMQNLTLAAHALGLGTVHVGWFDAAKVAQILEVPEGIAVVEVTPLGHPDDQPVAPRRKELPEFVFYDKYGQGKS